MAFPTSPVNGQQATVNGITYVYVSSKNAWNRQTGSFSVIGDIQLANVAYNANYSTEELVHSNYKLFTYKGSSVDQISITCDFTAQDTKEANYLLAVIHFFRSVTKMFYGQDNGPKPGTPPPLCFLTGLGAFQFNEHPLEIGRAHV